MYKPETQNPGISELRWLDDWLVGSRFDLGNCDGVDRITLGASNTGIARGAAASEFTDRLPATTLEIHFHSFSDLCVYRWR